MSNVHPLYAAIQTCSVGTGTIDMSQLCGNMASLYQESIEAERDATRKRKQEEKEKTREKKRKRVNIDPHPMSRRSTIKQIMNKENQSSDDKLKILSVTGKVRCISCRKDKTTDAFYSAVAKKIGIMSTCIDCIYDKFNDKPRENFIRHMYIDCRNRSKKKKFAFDLELSDLHQLYDDQEGKCALSGQEMTFIHKRGKRQFTRHPTNASLDRIDPKGGYTKDNIQLTTNVCNIAKMDLTEEMFIDMCEQVYNKRRRSISVEQS